MYWHLVLLYAVEYNFTFHATLRNSEVNWGSYLFSDELDHFILPQSQNLVREVWNPVFIIICFVCSVPMRQFQLEFYQSHPYSNNDNPLASIWIRSLFYSTNEYSRGVWAILQNKLTLEHSHLKYSLYWTPAKCTGLKCNLIDPSRPVLKYPEESMNKMIFKLWWLKWVFS